MRKDLTQLPEWHAVCQRYRYNITRFAIEALGMTPTLQQRALFVSVAQNGSRTSVASGHGTGKTRSSGVIALWHLLFFPHSVMMSTAPQIDQLRKLVFKEIAICLTLLTKNSLGWLADYITILSESVYIKGHQKTWHIIAKTAPKNQPTNLAGQHGDNYGIEYAALQAVIEVEAGGSGFVGNLPKILYEPHIMHRRLTAKRYITIRNRMMAEQPKLCYSKWGMHKYGKVSEQHQRLAIPSQYDRDTALESCSWGMGQVMGFHWKSLGYNSLQEFVNAMYESEAKLHCILWQRLASFYFLNEQASH